METRSSLRLLSVSAEAVISYGLIAKLDAELAARYPGQVIHGIDAKGFAEGGGHFLVAKLNDDPIACGAFRPLDDATIEIKRMYTRPAARGMGAARAILNGLECEARRRHFKRAVLETGLRQPEALALYECCGYAPITAFGSYADSGPSVFLGKDL